MLARNMILIRRRDLERAREFSGVCARSSGAGPYLLSMFDDCKMEFVGEWMHELHVRSI